MWGLREAGELGIAMHEIRIVTPLVTQGLRVEEHVADMCDSETKVTATIIDKGPASLEGEFDKALCVPDTINKIIEAEREGCAAIVIDCMGDPGVDAAREVVSIPVFGPGEVTFHVASTLGHSYSVVTVLKRLRVPIEKRAKLCGTLDKLASVRSVDIPVLELDKDPDRLREAFIREAIAAVEEDDAHVILFGCTGMFGWGTIIKKGLEDAGYAGVPVIDPIPTTVRYAAAMVKCGLAHSKLTYPQPRPKAVVGFDLPSREAAE